MASKPPPSVFTLTKSIDPRIAPEDANYTAPTGASSITQVQQKLLQVNNSVHTFNVTPPSAGAVIQKAIQYTMVGRVDFSAAPTVYPNPWSVNLFGAVPYGAPFPVYGRDFAIAKANPLNSMVLNWQVQINNATVQFNNQGIDDLVHLMETPATRSDKGVTTRTPVFTTWDDAAESPWALGGVEDLQGRGDVPPGAYQVQWVIPATGGPYNLYYAKMGNPGNINWVRGAALSSGQTLTSAAAYAYGPGGYNLAPGDKLVYSSLATNPGGAVWVPGPDAVEINWETGADPNPLVGTPALSSFASAVAAQNYALAFFMVDTVQCPPFGWHVTAGFEDQGMWGVNNMLITAQLTDPGQARWLQGTQRYGLGSLTYKAWNCTEAALWFTYLSPSTTNLEVLPPRCVLPLMYKQVTTYVDPGTYQPSFSSAISPYSPTIYQLQVPSYTFSQVSDLIVISVRPFYNPFAQPNTAGYIPFWQTDFCAAIPGQVFSQFQYANIPGILSNLAANQSVAICKKNGSRASVSQFGGLVGQGLMMKSGLLTAMGGSPLVLKPGTDFALPIGIAPGSMGNIQLQFTIQFINQSAYEQSVVCTTMSLSSGFFLLDNGAARQVLVGLNSKSLYDADVTMASMDSEKLTGGGLMSTLASFAGKAWRIRKHIGKVGMAAKDAWEAWKNDKGGSATAGGGGGAPYAMAGAGLYRGGNTSASAAGAKRRADSGLDWSGGATYRSSGGGGSAASRPRGSLLEAIGGDEDPF